MDISVSYITGTEEQQNDGFIGRYMAYFSKPGKDEFTVSFEISEEEFAELSAEFDLSVDDVREE